MWQRKHVPLHVEALEDRWVPATVKFIGGSLYVSNPLISGGSSSLSLKQTAPNTFQVVDGSATLGTYSGVGNLSINGNNAKGTITVDLNGKAFTGNLFVNGGNGNDTVAITNGSPTAATVGGTTTILPGLGNDSINLNSTATSALTFGGSVQVTKTAGAGTLNLGNGSAPTTFGGDVTSGGMATVNMGFGQPDRYGGNVTVNGSPNLTLPGMHFVLFGSTGAGTAVTIQKNLTVIGTAGADSVSLSPGATTVNGTATFNLGEGNDNLQVAAILGAVQVNGDFVVSEGGGNDSLSLSPSPATPINVGGSMQLTYGDGNNFIGINPHSTPSALNISGDFALTLGNGNNPAITMSGAVAGNMFFNLGNGNDASLVNHAPGGRLNWTSGNGNDSVRFGGATSSAGETWNVNMRFGTGSNTVTLADGPMAPNITPATPDFLTGFIDLGGPPGGNVFDSAGSTGRGSWVIVPPFTLLNA